MVLLAVAARELSVPYLASGGIGDGRGLAASLALGADGVNMGTRFMATKEAPIHPKVKQFLIDADERQSILMFRTLKHTARVLRNAVSEKVVEIESRPGDTDFADLSELVSGEKGRAALLAGETDQGVIWGGMVTGVINDAPTCEELLSKMVSDATDIVKNMSFQVA